MRWPSHCSTQQGAMSVPEWVRWNGMQTGGGMDWSRVERVVFIDSTWPQTKKIIKVSLLHTCIYK